MVNALRMLCFGAASVLVCVPANLLVWIMSGRLYSLSWMLSLSLSGLFLYGALSLFCLRLRGRRGRWPRRPSGWRPEWSPFCGRRRRSG